jgi:hypothetical protein
VDRLSAAETARLLGTTKPTVHALLEKQTLRGVKEQRGTRCAWRVDRDSAESFLGRHGRYDNNRRPRADRLAKLEDEVAALRDLLAKAAPGPGRAVDRPPAERDELRVHLMNLEEVLTRSRAVAELQRSADEERGVVVEHLLAALAAGERADGLRRQATAQLEEALAAFSRPGHAGAVTSASSAQS